MSQQGFSLQKLSHFAMGTLFEITLFEADVDYAHQVSQAVFSEIDRLESLLSRFDPGSPISLINRLKPGQTLSVSVEVYECLNTAFLVQEQSGGAFDINYSFFENLNSQDHRKYLTTKNKYL